MPILNSTRRQFLAGSAAAVAASAQDQPRNERLFSGRVSAAALGAALVSRERWKPFPVAPDRAAWGALPATARKSLIEAGERHLGKPWQVLPATLFLEYARAGNRSNYERVRSARRDQLREVVIAECLEGKGRFLDDIANGVWATCEETFWGVPAHLSLQKRGSGLPDVTEPVVDLFAAETASLLAWTHYLLEPQLERVHPLVGERIRVEVDRRILTPNLERTDFWWMGLDPKRGRDVNNWNPWINSNWLTCVLLLETDPARRNAAAHKILRSLDRFTAAYHADGGCDEGPGYWGRAGASLFDCLELLYSASEGRIDYYGEPLVREIGRYIVRAHIHEDWFTNFADASARVSIAGDLVCRYGRRIGDEDMRALGAYAAGRHGALRSESIGRQLPALFHLEELGKVPARQPLLRDVWLPGIQVMAARVKAGSAQGLYLAAQGGHNAESHNHNDVGNFLVYADGQPAIVDVGVETYSAKTFSAKRYEIWTMQSAYHNLPTIDGVMQSAGRQFAASEVDYRAAEDAAEFRLNIAGAYPPEAGLAFWRRSLRLDRRRNRIEVRDHYSLNKRASRVTLTLMTPCEPRQSGAGEITLAGAGFASGPVRILYDAGVLAPSIEPIPIEDGRLRGVWGARLYRILLAAQNPAAEAVWMIEIRQGTAG